MPLSPGKILGSFEIAGRTWTVETADILLEYFGLIIAKKKKGKARRNNEQG